MDYFIPMQGYTAEDWLQASSFASPCGVLFGFAFGLYEGIGTMSCVAVGFWVILGLALAILTWYGAAQNCRTAREAKEELGVIRNSTGNSERNFERLLRSQQSPTEKVINLKKYAVASSAFRLAKEISRYLDSPKLTRRSALFRWLPISWRQMPEAAVARTYRDLFGEQLTELIDQFKEMNVVLPQREGTYTAPSTCSEMRLVISQIKEAANRIVSDVSADAAVFIVSHHANV